MASARVVTAEDIVRLYNPVGQIVVIWGLTDATINHIGFFMVQAMKNPAAAHDWPVGFGRRLSVIEQNLKKVPAFASLKVGGLAILRAIREMSVLRDMLIHGAAIRYDEEKDAYVYHRIDKLTEKQKRSSKSLGLSHTQNRMTIRFKVLEEAAERCLVINDRLATIRDALGEM